MLSKPTPKAPMITIAGTAGSGKTTLAAMFPKAAFITAEDGTAVFDGWSDEDKPLVFPRIDEVKPFDDLKKQLRWFYGNIGKEHDRQTLVIDTVTKLDKMFQNELCIRDKVSNIGDAAGGFHKGFLEVSKMHSEIVAIGTMLQKKGITVIWLGHTGIMKMKNRPDSEDYTVFTLDMDEKSRPHYINESDVVSFISKKEFVKGAEVSKRGQTTRFGKLVQTGERELITETDGKMGFPDAKTRWSMDSILDLPKGENPLIELIPFFNTNK